MLPLIIKKMTSTHTNNTLMCVDQIQTDKRQGQEAEEPVVDFELPQDIGEEDEHLLTGILSVLCSTELCHGYKVQIMPPPHQNAFLIRGALHEDVFEVSLDDMHFIQNADPLRIEKIVVSRCGGGNNELVLKVLNSKQRVILTESSTFYVCRRKRKFSKISEA